MKLKAKAEKISNKLNKKPNMESLIPDSLHKKPHSPHHGHLQCSPGSIPTTALDFSKYPSMILIEEIVSMFQEDPPMMGIQSMLKELGLTVSVQFLEVMLKLSYRTSTKALKCFHWSVQKLDTN